MHTTPRHLFACIVFLLAAAVAFSGCTGTGNAPEKSGSPTPSGTAVQVSHVVMTEAQNNATVYVKQGNYIIVQLAENPTTGYQWNLTTTPGLVVTNDTYEPSDTSGKLVGSGGTRTWEMTAAEKGDQEIHAVYGRSWEPVTGSETTFSATVVVE
jgi:inhibitor of cysteine peptidase